MKRPSPTPEDHARNIKNQKVEGRRKVRHKLKYQQSFPAELPLRLQDEEAVDDLLRRTICVALYAAGFTSVKTSALESFRALASEYMTAFANDVHASMQHCRRSQSLPQDFISALVHSKLTSSSLLEDLQLQISAEVSQPPLQPPLPDTTSKVFLDIKPLSSTMEKERARQRHAYIPNHFPMFPSAHTYKGTAVYTQRESDPRKVRELATQEGSKAEQALRRLMAARNNGSKTAARSRLTTELSLQRQKSDALCQDTLTSFVERDDETRKHGAVGEEREMDIELFGLDGANDDPLERKVAETERNFGAPVDYDRRYWRSRGWNAY